MIIKLRTLEERYGAPSNARVILLSAGKFALVDEQDYIELNKVSWHTRGKYACSGTFMQRGKYVFMHRRVLEIRGVSVPDGFVTHHVNGDGCDNRFSNLQVVSPSYNIREGRKSATNIYRSHHDTYVVRFRLDGVTYKSGSFFKRSEAEKLAEMVRNLLLATADHEEAKNILKQHIR